MVEERVEVGRKLITYDTTSESLPWARRAWHGSFVFRQGVNLAAFALCNASLAVLSAWYIVTRRGIKLQERCLLRFVRTSPTRVKTPAKVSAIVYTIYLPFKILMFLRYGVVGLGITVSAYCLTNFLVQFAMLERDVERKLEND